MEKERMKEIIRRSNSPGMLIKNKGKEHLVHAYQKDTEDLIIYIRELEGDLGVESVRLYS